MSRTAPLRASARYTEDRALLHEILDEGYVAHLALVVDGEPRVLPMFHVRLGDNVYVHASTGGRYGLAARSGELRLCLAVTILDGLVLAKSQFSHSANYRSVVVHGLARPVTDPTERDRVLTAFAEKVATGRSKDSRPPNRKELAQTALLALSLDEVTVKARSGGPLDEVEDLDLPHWSGVIPLSTVRGAPRPADAAPLPGYLADSAWLHPVTLTAERVRLEPLRVEHAKELFTATDDPDVWAKLLTPRPRSVTDLADIIEAALDQPGRVAWAQIDTATGQAVGTTSFYDVDPDHRAVAIGYTWLGKPWWRSGINHQAKLLLLRRAFDGLGCHRVSWHTDGDNLRSQAAIERLGAHREGVLRYHRVRPDGSLRDTWFYGMTVDGWPAARDQLEGWVHC